MSDAATVAKEIVDDILFYTDPEQAVHKVVNALTTFATQQVAQARRETWEKAARIAETFDASEAPGMGICTWNEGVEDGATYTKHGIAAAIREATP